MKATVHLELGKILATAAKRRAADIHLIAGSLPVLRLDTGLLELTDAPVMTKDFLEDLRVELIEEGQRLLLERYRSVRFVYLFEDKLRVRVSAFYQKGGLAFTLRLISTTVPELGVLGLPAAVARLSELRRGLVVITGPYSSGRTTTAAALLQHVNQTRSENILTIEQPVEYLIANAKSLVVQREVGRDVPSFLQAIEECRQEDITVVLVGESEEPGVLRATLELAAIGRLVFSVMNAVTTLQAVERLAANFPADQRSLGLEQLAESLAAVVAQRLLPSLSGGRILAHEVLTATPATRALYRDGRFSQLQSVLQTSQQEGMVSLDQTLAALVKSGTVASAAALSEAYDPDNLRQMIRGYG